MTKKKGILTVAGLLAAGAGIGAFVYLKNPARVDNQHRPADSSQLATSTPTPAPAVSSIPKTLMGSNFTVCAATLVSEDSSEGDYVSADFIVGDVIQGAVVTGQITVVFLKSTAPDSLPTNAIVIVSSRAYGGYTLVGLDASKGLLVDTPSERSRVSQLSVNELITVPQDEWLPEEVAVRIGESHLIETGEWSRELVFDTVRYEFGWHVICGRAGPDRKASFKHARIFTISDTGQLLSSDHAH